MSRRFSWLHIACGTLLLAPATAFSQSNQNYTGTREQRQQQTGSSNSSYGSGSSNTSYGSDSSSSNRPNPPDEAGEDQSDRRSSQQSGSQQSGSQQYDSQQNDRNQSQRNQGYDRSNQQSSDRFADQRQGWNENRQSSNGYGQQFGNQQYGQQYGNQQSGNQQYGQGEQQWSGQRSGQYVVNPERWRIDKEYRDAYFAGLRAGQRGADESNYSSFSTSSSESSSGDNLGLDRRVRLIGRVIRTSRIGSGDSQHLQAQIRTDRGDRYWVDLGSADEARKLDLGEGDQITVKGIRLRLGDRTLVFATDANANDERLSANFRDASERSSEQTGYDSDRSSDRQSDRQSQRYLERQSSGRDQSGSQSRSSRDESDESQNRSSSQSRSQSDRSSSDTESQAGRDRSSSR